MAIIDLKAWYLGTYEPIRDLEKRPQDLRLSKNSLLKSALRADFLDDAATVKESEWFQRYLDGETVEFYVEGSGAYTIANVDLISHELYLVKQGLLANLDPLVFFCHPTPEEPSTTIVYQALSQSLQTLNQSARIPLKLQSSHRPSDAPLRLASSGLRMLRRSLILVVDGTPLVSRATEPPQLIPSPQVCVELGYGLHCKRPEQILLIHQERSDCPGLFPFDVSREQTIRFSTEADLQDPLQRALESLYRRFNLLGS